jgi:hypothetical protein
MKAVNQSHFFPHISQLSEESVGIFCFTRTKHLQQFGKIDRHIWFFAKKARKSECSNSLASSLAKTPIPRANMPTLDLLASCEKSHLHALEGAFPQALT